MKTHFVALAALLASAGIAFAQGAIEPETLTVEPRISEGGHVFVMNFGINGPSQIIVLNADDLSLEGTVTAGTFAQMLMTTDKDAFYTSGAYLSRYTYGDIEGVIQEWDPVSLELRREFIVSSKMAPALSQRGLLKRSADGAFLIVQNATPATSVTIVDVNAGEPIAEIPTPGCWTAYPTLEATAFTSLCGDGTLAKYTYSADGSFAGPVKSEKIFDAETEPLWGHAVRVGDDLVYMSYGGTLFLVDDAGEKPELSGKFTFAEEGWAPSGYNLMAYHEPSDTMFILMHQNPFDGSHKVPAEEIWAVNMADQAVVGRFAAHGEGSITVGGEEEPVLLGLDHMGGVHSYTVTMGETVDGNQTASKEGVVFFGTDLIADF